jgi:membrane associated rhomboid family serine protease
MLVVPISGKIGWKRPPLVTLALVLTNCLVFFLFQTHDDQYRAAAEQFYLDSGLAAIEAPYYLHYLKDAGKTGGELPDVDKSNADKLMRIHYRMESDAVFLARLNRSRIITPGDPGYRRWKTLRRFYEDKRNRSVAFAHGLRPAYPRASTFFTYMFLHGGVGHLVGNMVFLWILGCMLEMGAGRLLFTAIYLASGLLSGGFFCLIFPLSTAPLVGASGAIAGLMGAYTVLYGKKRINVFYSVGVYFNTARIRAIALLPVWLANECYQQFFNSASHVAYAAHMGGIAGGAVLALAGERLLGGLDRDCFEEAPEDRVSPLLDRALDHMGNLEMSRALPLLEEVLGLSPDNREALTHLFNIHKLNPESPAFHDAARRLLGVLVRHRDHHQAALACYETYTRLARRPKLSIPLYLQIAGMMALAGKVGAAEKIVLAVLKKQPQSPGLPSILVKLAQAFYRNGRTDRFHRYRQLVCKQFPHSAEAALMKKAQS